MTDREKAIVTAYTGVVMLGGDKLSVFYQYVHEKLGHCVMTHELAYQEVQDAIQEATKEDFIAIAKADNGWISIKDRLPEIRHAVLVYTPHHYNLWAASLHEDGDWYFWMPGTMKYDPDWYGPITHWLPLPEPPKEE